MVRWSMKINNDGTRTITDNRGTRTVSAEEGQKYLRTKKYPPPAGSNK